MAVYNGRRFLDEQLTSLLADLEPCDELIVVDDSSTDGSFAMLQSLGDIRVKLVRNDGNQGVRRSFERGLRMATNEVIFLCDQDDLWRAGKRRAFVEAFDDDEHCLVVVSDASLIDAESRPIADSFMEGRGGFRSGFWSNVVRNRYLGCAMAVRRRLLTAALPIPSRVPMHDMWLGILGGRLGHVAYLPDSWIAYRRHGDNVTPSSRRGWGQILVWRLQLLRALTTRLVALAFNLHRTGPDGLSVMNANTTTKETP
jgi:glycosyltransferase involved in cell wall biosynthesis